MNKRMIPACMLVCSMGFAGILGNMVSVCGYEDNPEAYQYNVDVPPEAPADGMGPGRNGMDVPGSGEMGAEGTIEDQAQEPDFEQWETEVYSGGGIEDFTEEETLTVQSEEEAVLIRNTEKESQVEDFEILDKEDAELAFELLAYEELPAYVYLEVPEILQNPELPTGCESVALTMALQYEGIELSKTTIAREFLIYNRETDNTALGYVGDPFSEEGAGCFAPAIAATAADFFQDQELDYTVYDITDSSINELLSYVAADTPVVVWTTMYMSEPEFTREDGEYGGRIYHWYRQEHCVVLSGYDLESNTLQINDPLEGIIDRDKDEFERIYNLTGRNAVVVKENVMEE